MRRSVALDAKTGKVVGNGKLDARALGALDEIAVITDIHPFPLTLRMEPIATRALVAFRMTIEQATWNAEASDLRCLVSRTGDRGEMLRRRRPGREIGCIS